MTEFLLMVDAIIKTAGVASSPAICMCNSVLSCGMPVCWRHHIYLVLRLYRFGDTARSRSVLLSVVYDTQRIPSLDR